jgi:hypothetical protein
LAKNSRLKKKKIGKFSGLNTVFSFGSKISQVFYFGEFSRNGKKCCTFLKCIYLGPFSGPKPKHLKWWKCLYIDPSPVHNRPMIDLLWDGLQGCYMRVSFKDFVM